MNPGGTKRLFMVRPSFLVLSMSLAVAILVAPIVACPVAADAARPGQEGQVAADRAPWPMVAEADRQGALPAPSDEFGNVTEEEAGAEPTEAGKISDPLEPVNRIFFKFNDKLYSWVLEPVARGYKKVVSEDFRLLFRNFYNNLFSPVRLVNKLIQLKIKDAGTEFARLAINSTIGVGGLRDCAGECFGVRASNADFGQTLGYYGVGQGFYLVWPVLGPSTARESVGFGFDYLLYPPTWLTSFPVSAGMWAHDRVNSLSFHLGDYEALKKAAVDPYLAIRNAYVQNRAAFVEEAKKGKRAKSTGGEEEGLPGVEENRP